ncbi:MAG: hypothetical protein JXO22_16875 [Phycisphaerae bacterium]|nr:hypothetical protein [Phycisphaerae bacterium]
MSCTRVFGCIAIIVVTGGLLVPGALADIDKKQAKQDWKQFADLCQKYQYVFMSQSEVKKLGKGCIEEWQAWKKEFEPLRETFKERYGTTTAEVLEKFEGVEEPLDVKMPAWQAAAAGYDIDIPRKEAMFAEWAVSWGKDAYRIANLIEDEKEKLELKVTRAEDAVGYFELAKMWNPDGDYDEYIEQAKAVLEKARPQWHAVLKDLKWPGNNPDFAGPGNPDELAAAAIEFLKKNPKWSKPEYDDEHTPIAACVEGKGWDVYKKAPVTEEPTQYSIDIFVAFKGTKDPKTAYCYHMVFYTAEEAGVKKGLPFHYANSKQYAKFRMLMENVPVKKQ